MDERDRFSRGVRRRIRQGKASVRMSATDQEIVSNAQTAVGAIVGEFKELGPGEILALQEWWAIRHKFHTAHDQEEFDRERKEFMSKHLGDEVSPQLLAAVKIITDSFAKLNQR